MTILAVLAGSVVGKLYDPLAWCLIGVVILLAARRHPWWHSAMAILAFTAANMALAYSWSIESGIAFHQARGWRIFFALLVIGVVAHGLGRAIAWGLTRRKAELSA